MIKIGLVGAANNSKIYAELVQQNSNVILSGIFDPDVDSVSLQNIANHYNCTYCTSYKKLLQICDVVVFGRSIDNQLNFTKAAIKAQKHLFLKKPLCQKIEEATELVKIAEEAAVKIAIGQTERFNQAFLSIKNKINKPLFIETHRCIDLQKSDGNINVITDLMVHDIDLILSLVKSNIKKVVASGVAVVNKKIDIANARVEFENGCIANLTANCIALEATKKITIFQKNQYIILNLLKRSAQAVNLSKSTNGSNQSAYTIATGLPTEKKYVYTKVANNPVEINALSLEFNLFIQSILQNTDPPVSIFEAYDALDLAHQIIKKIKNNSIVVM